MSDAKRAGLYIRVSTEEQGRGFSLGAQEEKLRERAAADGATVTDLFSDTISGAKSDRPDYQRLLAAAAAGELDLVYVWKLDRLGRDAEELLRARRMLNAAGVRIVSVTEGEDDSTLVFGIRALVAEEEREKIKQRTTVGKAAAAALGRPNGGRRRYAFERAEGKKGTLPPTRPDELAVVERVFRETVEGRSQGAIARGLNADGIKTVYGKAWGQPQIGALLNDPIWLGVLRNGQGEFRVFDEALIDADLVNAARATLKGPEGPRAGRRTLRFLLGNGLLRCGQCGNAMRVKRAGSYEAYVCNSFERCPQKPVRRAAVDSAVLAFFEQTSIDMEQTKRDLQARADHEQALLADLIASAERDEAQARERLTRVRRDYQDGKLDADDWSQQRVELQNELQAAQDNAERLRTRHAEAGADESAVDDLELLQRLAEIRAAVAGDITANPEDFEATRAALRRVFKAFHLRPVSGVNWWSQPWTHPYEPVLDGIPALMQEDQPLPTYVLEPEPRQDAITLRGGEVSVRPVSLGLRGGIKGSSSRRRPPARGRSPRLHDRPRLRWRTSAPCRGGGSRPRGPRRRPHGRCRRASATSRARTAASRRRRRSARVLRGRSSRSRREREAMRRAPSRARPRRRGRP